MEKEQEIFFYQQLEIIRKALIDAVEATISIKKKQEEKEHEPIRDKKLEQFTASLPSYFPKSSDLEIALQTIEYFKQYKEGGTK